MHSYSFTAPKRCLSCSGKYSTEDYRGCIGCLDGTVVNGTCDCGDRVKIEVDESGSLLEEVKCVQCLKGYVYSRNNK